MGKKQLLFLVLLITIRCTEIWSMDNSNHAKAPTERRRMDHVRSLISSAKQTFHNWKHEKLHAKFFNVVRETKTDDITRLQKLLARPGIDIHKKDAQGRSVLHIAAQYSTPDAVKCLVQHNAQIDVLDTNGNTPMHYAMLHWFSPFTDECIIFLTECGAQVNVQNNEGDTPMHNIAMLKPPWKTVACLKERGANIDACNNLLRTPLHNAVVRANRLAVVKLIAQGAALNAQDAESNTPLHLAFGHHEPFFEIDTDDNRRTIIKDLLKAGASITSKNNNGLEPCAYMHSLLFEAVYQPLIEAIKNNKSAEVRRLLAQGANININITTENMHYDATHLLNIATNCPRTMPDMVCLLLDAGANPAMSDHQKHTVLGNAFMHGDLEKARLLITHIPRTHIIQKWNKVALPLLLGLKRMRQLPLDVRRLLCLYCVRSACIDEQIERCRNSFKTMLFAFASHTALMGSNEWYMRTEYHYEWRHILDNIPTWHQQITHAIKNKPKALP